MAEITYMDCWHFIAPLIPFKVDTYSMDVYVMTFQALKEAEEGEGKQWLSILSVKLQLRRWRKLITLQSQAMPTTVKRIISERLSRACLPPTLRRWCMECGCATDVMMKL